jgi:outer membrane protein assembly factor BamD (BamD/ComL family)
MLPEPTAARVATPPSKPWAAAPPTFGATVADQARNLDDARATIAAGRGPHALAMLDDFARRFPSSPLEEEALVLRIEALVTSGDRSAASTSAARFFARYPNSPYVRRVRSVVGDSAPE